MSDPTRPVAVVACLRRRFRRVASPPAILALIVLLLIGVLLVQSWNDARPDSIGEDAAQNLRSAWNLSQHGVYGESVEGMFPGFRREPLPNWVLAGHLKWLVRPPGGIDAQHLTERPDLLTRIVRVNFVYLLGLFLSLWVLCLRLIRPVWLAHLVAMAVIYYSAKEFAVDELTNLNTELPASFLLILSGLSFVLLRQRSQWGWGLLAGVLFGCLVLTKASGAYLALVVLPLLPLLLRCSPRKSITLGLSVALGFALTVLPWVGRNLIEFGSPSIAWGGGRVLLFRSAYNQMTADEFKGAFYAYAPKRMQKDLLEPTLGFFPSQLQCGGSLQRLQRNLPCEAEAMAEGRSSDVISYYKNARIKMHQLNSEARMRGVDSITEDYIQKAAIQRIKAAPVKHLLVSLPLAWRGMWSFENQKTWFGVIANALAMASLLAMPWLGVLLRKPDWTLMSVLGSGYFLFYALLSHFIPRYSEPLVPLSLVCLSVLLIAAIRKAGSWLLPVCSWPSSDVNGHPP